MDKKCFLDPTPPPNPQFQLDFTYQAKQPAMLLLHVITAMRHLIRQRRQDKNSHQTLTYSVECSEIDVCAIRGHVILRKQEDPNKTKISTHAVKEFPKVNTVFLKISVNDIYPSSMGYAIYMNQPAQCYHVWIGKEPFTFVGIVYPSQPSHYPKLTDLLGILVAEQIRFNTLDVYLNTFKNKAASLSVNELYYNLFQSFKNSVYNNWSKSWNQEEKGKGKGQPKEKEKKWSKGKNDLPVEKKQEKPEQKKVEAKLYDEKVAVIVEKVIKLE